MINVLEKYKQNLLDRYPEPSTLDELAELVVADINRQLAQHNNRVVGFAWDLTYSNTVGNSHSRPILGVENFVGNPNLPGHYPGFNGRVWIRLERYYSEVSNLFKPTLTYTGTGGIGSYNSPWENYYRAYYATRSGTKQILPYFTWDYRFYLSDWSLIEDLIMGQQIINVLSESQFKYKHKYTWTDPDTAAKDDLAISKYREKQQALG